MNSLTLTYHESRGFVSYGCPLCHKEFPMRRIALHHLATCEQAEADAQERVAEPDATFAALVKAGQTRRKGTRS